MQPWGAWSVAHNSIDAGTSHQRALSYITAHLFKAHNGPFEGNRSPAFLDAQSHAPNLMLPTSAPQTLFVLPLVPTPRRVLTMEWVDGVKLTTLPPDEVRTLVKVRSGAVRGFRGPVGSERGLSLGHGNSGAMKRWPGEEGVLFTLEVPSEVKCVCMLPLPCHDTYPAPAPPHLPAYLTAALQVGQAAFLTQLLEIGFIHGDPHPGNLLREYKLAIMHQWPASVIGMRKNITFFCTMCAYA